MNAKSDGIKVHLPPVTVRQGPWGTTIQKTVTVIQRKDAPDEEVPDDDIYKVVPPDGNPLPSNFRSKSAADPIFDKTEAAIEAAHAAAATAAAAAEPSKVRGSKGP